MKTLLIVLCIMSAKIAMAQTRINATIEADSVLREFIVSLPSGGAPSGGFPVVFMLHGTTDSGEVFYNTSGWKEKGEEEKFITVFPSSLRYCVDEGSGPYVTTKWHSGEVDAIACPGQHLKDDVKFFRMMVDTIKKTFSVDASRIYATGFSSGGMMVSKLLIEMNDVFAALNIHAGGLNDNDSGFVEHKRPVVYSIGADDDQSLNYGFPSFPFNDSTLAIHQQLIRKYLGVLDLGEEFTKDSTALVLRYRFNTLAATAAWEFNYLLFKGLEHKYPNPISYPIHMADLLWAFFEQYSLPLSVSRATEIGTIHLRPNPATTHLIADNDATITLVAATGAEVFTTSARQGERIALPKLAAGIYLAKIATTEGLRVAKVIIE
jgi:poly(3-hydroxybutyrate) depolymerase